MNGLIKWFVENPVAANLLMIMIIIGGFAGFNNIGKTAFPEFSTDNIQVTVSYLGAGPLEVEERILTRVEEAVFDIPGIEKIRAVAREGFGSVTLEVEDGYNVDQVLNEVKAQVDGINTFPALSERPIVGKQEISSELMQMAIYGDVTERELKEINRNVKNRLLQIPGLTQFITFGTRPYEISIELSEFELQKYGLTFDSISQAISRSSINLPAGRVDNEAGQIQIIARGQAYNQEDFENIVVLRNPDGTRVLLKDVAKVIDGFDDSEFVVRVNQRPATVIIPRMETGYSVVELSDEVRRILDQEVRPSLPENVSVEIFFDASDPFEARLNMLLGNGISGLVLVFIGLSLFLTVSLAGWVTVGIAVTFLGCFWFLPYMGVQLNMISLFAFILILGIVVDDAIIIGESIHRENQLGSPGNAGAIQGAGKVAKPVIFSALTTMIAFSPLLFIAGGGAKFIVAIPVVVILCLVFSLIESLFILPSHLRHGGEKKESFLANFFKPFFEWSKADKLLKKTQQSCQNFLDTVVHKYYRPFLDIALKRKYFSLATFLSVGMIIMAIPAAGWLKFVFFPDVTLDFVDSKIEFPQGTPYATVEKAGFEVEEVAWKLKKQLAEENGGQDVVKHIQMNANSNGTAEVKLFIAPSETRASNVPDLARRFREMAPFIPDAKDVNFSYTINQESGGIAFLLRSNELDQLNLLKEELKQTLREYDGVFNITESSESARNEAVLSLLPSGDVLNFSLTDVGRQVRQAFFGEEVQRIPLGEEDVKVMVRLPKEDRKSFDTLNEMRLRTNSGAEVPFESVAKIDYKPGYTKIERTDRQRTLVVSANLDSAVANAEEIFNTIFAKKYPEWKSKYPAAVIDLEGGLADQREFFADIYLYAGFAVLAIYSLMAIAFRSYTQPILILTALPFGYIGAVIGHMVMGMNISMFSILGIVAAAGVVVNDNLVLLDYINRMRAEGKSALEAIEKAAEERFRPIFLTSFTTFIGLAPLMSETSIQAQFLIPTVVSLAFGVLLATSVTLILVPVLYLILADVRNKLNWLLGKKQHKPNPNSVAE